MSHLRSIFSILVFLILLTGCGKSSPHSVSTTASSLGFVSTPSPTCQPPSLENCYTKEQMKEYLDEVAIPYVDKFSQDTYSHMSLPQYVYIPEGETILSTCGQLEENAYAFCRGDDTVYIGQTQEWQFYQEYGSISPVFGVAHEFGHHIQFKAGIPQPTSSQEEVNHENQADCIAGAWVLWADQVAHILEYPKDLGNIDALLVRIADVEGPNQTHGTASERVRSFERGHSSGLPACNSYYPDQPILTQS